MFFKFFFVAGKTDSKTFVKKRTFVGALWETGWGKMTVMTMGSFHDFIQIVTLICNLQLKVHVFPKTLIFIFSIETIYFSLEGRYVRRLFVQNIEYNHVLLPRQIYPVHLHVCLWIFMYFYRFLQIFIDFHRFTQIFMDLH